MKIKVENGVAHIEPGGTTILDLLARLGGGESVDSVKSSLGITDENHWITVADAIFNEWKSRANHPDGDDALVAEINKELSKYALAFPVYGTVAEAKKVQELLKEKPPNVDEASKIIFAAIMQPRMRALQLVGRFMKIPLFSEFAYFIDSATVAYYRGNVAAAFLTIVPVIEGIILRWYGFPATAVKKPDFEKTKKYIGRSIYRQPIPLIPNFLESYVHAANEILVNHLYKNSETGPAQDDFNRHLALHMLDNTNFYSHDNVMRAFLLLDLLSEIYICEKRIADPRWNTERSEEDPHQKAYISAILQQHLEDCPERILFSHRQHLAAESIGI
jgi:hypothetical protein